jgi:hypothetical protein
MEDQTETAEVGEVVDAEFEIVPDVPAMSQLELEHYHEIIRLNKEVKLKQYKYDAAKAEAKFCKEDLDCAAMELSTLIADGPQKPDPQKELPFAAADSGDKPSWELTPITDALKMTTKQREKLEEIGIKTVGQFEFLRAGRDPVYPDGLRSVKGFGAATVDAFENDIVNWLQANAREPEPNENENEG